MTPFPLFFFFFINLNILSKRKPGFASAATYWKKKKKTQKHSKESKMLDYSTHGSEISLKKLSEKKKKESYTKNPLITN